MARPLSDPLANAVSQATQSLLSATSQSLASSTSALSQSVSRVAQALTPEAFTRMYATQGGQSMTPYLTVAQTQSRLSNQPVLYVDVPRQKDAQGNYLPNNTGTTTLTDDIRKLLKPLQQATQQPPRRTLSVSQSAIQQPQAPDITPEKASSIQDAAHEIAASISGSMGGGGQGPPRTPPPNEPPAEEPPEDNSIRVMLDRLTQLFQRFFGNGNLPADQIRNNLANNLSEMIGGVRVGDNPINNFMETFSRYMGVRGAQPATVGIPQAPARGFTQRLQRTTRGLIGRGLRAFRPIARNAGRLVPRGIRTRLQRAGQRAGFAVARMAGANLGTAARFGTALGGAAAAGPIGLAVVLGLKLAFQTLSSAIGSTIRSLERMKAAALSNVQALSKYSGDLAAGKATLDVGRELRSIREAMALGASGRRLLEAQNKLEQAKSPWNLIAARLETALATAFTRLQTNAMEATNDGLMKYLELQRRFYEMLPEIIGGEAAKGIKALEQVFKDAKDGPVNAWQDWKTAMVDADMDFANRMKGPRKPGGAN